ncbi:hypothetical protein QF000_001699 [Paraburkholderia atlantica]|uniref:hypothetical protein n=1 Tax=Paraburkholderia atlantica TaxID=2654982 RepID=UPI003D192E1F
MSSRTLLVVTNERGNVVATAHEGSSSNADMNIGISALPGQTLHRIQVPDEIFDIKSGHDFHCAISSIMIAHEYPTTKFEMKRKPPSSSKKKKS